ncbi:MAG: tRNA 2-thiouridine(34) synthase MnmA [Magnetococcales bacterium]|nr:tRNA 2-thiouridine(34) synthase MnmA [Magnetococcales bacterium]
MTEITKKERIAVAMSGGVDSSTVAAHLLEQGHEVIGLTMQLWDHGQPSATSGGSRTCCALDDVHDARRVAETLGIPFYVVDKEQVFREQVVGGFMADYAAGLTPNPCIRCNQILKFEQLLTNATTLGCTALATGHYAVISSGSDGEPSLYRGADPAKDQSYFLFTLTRNQMQRVLFPLGGLHKRETRAMAERFGLHLAEKRESQDVCFVPDGDYGAFFQQHGSGLVRPGPIVTRDGAVLGEHRGIVHYTIGQRRGLGVAVGEPLYVLEIRPEEETVVVGPEQGLFKQQLVLAEVNWLESEPIRVGRRLQAKIRYASAPEPAEITAHGHGEVTLRFDQPQRAVTPGQACVFYQGDRVLGGGWIQRRG